MQIRAEDKDSSLFQVRDEQTGEIIHDCAYADDVRGMYCVLKRDHLDELVIKNGKYDAEMCYGDIIIEKRSIPDKPEAGIQLKRVIKKLALQCDVQVNVKTTEVGGVRTSWDDYFMQIASAVASRSTCMRRKVGAVFIKDRRIVATGYNGVPPGVEHCDTYGCIRQQRNIPSGTQLDICRASHAEENAVLQAALHGVSLRGCDVYLSGPHPCLGCAKKLITLGVRTVFYTEKYADEMAKNMLAEAGVELVRI